MRIQVIDALAQQRDLHFRRTGVFYMLAILFNQSRLGLSQAPSPSRPLQRFFRLLFDEQTIIARAME